MSNYAKTFLILDFLSCVPILTARYYYYSFDKSYLDTHYPLKIVSLCDMEWFKICYYLKLIRINQFYRIFSDMSRLEITMKRKWLTKIVQIDNLFAMIRLQILFFFSIHIMSCIWVALNLYHGGIIEAKILAGDYEKGLYETSPLAFSELPTVYIDSLYFVTTSMTTVGYGDIVASSSEPERNSILMMFTMIMQFSGILLFSLTSLRVRSLKSNLDVKGLLKTNLDSMIYFMLEIDNVLEGDIPSKMYDAAIDAMRDSILDSTVNVFKNYPFF